MTMKNKLMDALFSLIIGTFYSYSLCRAVLDATIFEVADTTLFITCAICAMAFCLVFFNRYTFLAVLMGAFLLVLFTFLSLQRQNFQARWYLDAGQSLRGLIAFFGGVGAHRPDYDNVFAMAVAVLFSFLAAVNIRIHFGFFMLTAVGATVIALPVMMNWGKSNTAIFLFVFCFLALLSKRLNLLAIARKNGMIKANPAFSVAALPLCAAILAIAFVLPKPENLPERSISREDIQNAADNLILDFTPGKTTAFSENGGRLGGPVRAGDEFVMTVRADERIYLSGSIRDIYTGSAWLASNQSDEDIPSEDGDWRKAANDSEDIVLQQMYYMRYYDWKMATVTVSIGDKRTRNIFSPPSRMYFWLSENTPVSRDSFGVLTSTRPLARNAGYSHQYISWNYDSIYFKNILRQAASASDVTPVYLDLPDSLPKRVSELALDITGGLDNGYDKMKALEGYLKGFPYTLTPETLPSGEDLVDYFLFTGKEGYCVYYASALAVMGRAAGIPTRYVEGFVMPEEQNENGSYTVTSSQAHAWTEAYFSGFGWVRFEPTAAGFGGEGGGLRPDAQPAPEVTQAPVQSVPEPETDTPQITGEPEQDNNTVPESTSQDSETAAFPSAFAVSALGLICFAGAVWALVYASKARLARIRRLPNRQAVEAYFKMILNAAAVCGYAIGNNETALAYVERIGGAISFSSGKITMAELAVIFSEAAYSNMEVSERDRETMRTCYLEIPALIRSSKKTLTGPVSGYLQYLSGRYILMRF